MCVTLSTQASVSQVAENIHGAVDVETSPVSPCHPVCVSHMTLFFSQPFWAHTTLCYQSERHHFISVNKFALFAWKAIEEVCVGTGTMV